jgi:3',5'-nucleoside bisphosphate phosphatase
MIDLHLHTTASDGRLAPPDLVRRAAMAGIRVMSVTDHDTVAGLPDARRAAEVADITFIDGVELTAVHFGRDVHILAYFIDIADETLSAFLQTQRDRRTSRLREIGERLAAIGVPIDVDALLAKVATRPGSSAGRPLIAHALVQARHATSSQDAFDRFLGTGQAAFVPRVGPTPIEVVELVHRVGGLASMAHPGVTKQPPLMAALVAAGLDAIEVYHSDHTVETRRDLEAFVANHHLLATGGSDFHGDDDRDRPLGGVTLPPAELARLETAARHRRAR